MSTHEIHLSEANKARETLQQRGTQLRRMHLLRTLVMVILVLLVYAHFNRVRQLNASRRAFGERTSPELAQTVLGFLADHRVEQNYEMRPDDDAVRLQRILAGIGLLSHKDVSVATHAGRTLQEVLEAAGERPEGIKVSLPYLGEVELPLTFSALALLSGISCLIANLLALVRQREVEAVAWYGSKHLRMLAVADDGTGPPQAEFDIEMRADPIVWPRELVKRPMREMMLGMLTGLSPERLKHRASDLVELGAGAGVAATLAAMYGMFWYLLLERIAWRLPTAAAMCGVAVLSAIGLVASVALILRLGAALAGQAARPEGELPAGPAPI